jgi:hypothetical protein
MIVVFYTVSLYIFVFVTYSTSLVRTCPCIVVINEEEE